LVFAAIASPKKENTFFQLFFQIVVMTITFIQKHFIQRVFRFRSAAI